MFCPSASFQTYVCILAWHLHQYIVMLYAIQCKGTTYALQRGILISPASRGFVVKPPCRITQVVIHK